MLKLAKRFEVAFWREYRVDGDLERAAVVAGIGSNTARRWVRESGGVMRIRTTNSGYRLSFEERELIEELHAQKVSQAEIARILGRRAAP